MKILLIFTLIASGLLLSDLAKEPVKDTPAYRQGVTDGELIGHNHQQNFGQSVSTQAQEALAESDLPWSVKLSRPRAINDYRAGWLDGYQHGVNFRRAK